MELMPFRIFVAHQEDKKKIMKVTIFCLVFIFIIATVCAKLRGPFEPGCIMPTFDCKSNDDCCGDGCCYDQLFGHHGFCRQVIKKLRWTKRCPKNGPITWSPLY
ncbi:uncharacterized protein LOC127279428 [Leptopilina boulardi]|uniref:uncharacterized protein LOC127279428 n=1 Tax=Leptopilina boulardi TaxID=63433 RepID=UPI0021F674B6|nr:uncharacterized protein LOC127279428 [Leptopilina boulardi]